MVVGRLNELPQYLFPGRQYHDALAAVDKPLRNPQQDQSFAATRRRAQDGRVLTRQSIVDGLLLIISLNQHNLLLIH